MTAPILRPPTSRYHSVFPETPEQVRIREASQTEQARTRQARTAWRAEHGYKIGVFNPCPAKRITGRHDRGRPGIERACCWTRDHRFFDHVWGITDTAGTRGLLTMPYGLSLDDAEDLASWCREHHATFTVLGTGWHHEGTVAIVIFPETPCPST